MPSNKRRHANAVPITSFVIWGAIGIFACAGGLSYVWCKNQLHTTGAEIKALERELVDLRNKNEVARTHIAQLSSTSSLQDRFVSGFIKMNKITGDKIVMIQGRIPAETAELRAVSNESSRP